MVKICVHEMIVGLELDWGRRISQSFVEQFDPPVVLYWSRSQSRCVRSLSEGVGQCRSSDVYGGVGLQR